MSLHKKEIQCTLANGEKSRFQGIGLAIIEIQPAIFLTLAPAYLSTKDDVNTISPGALKRYSKCTEASHEALEHVKITTSKNQKMTLPTITVAGLDCLKIKTHHFKEQELYHSNHHRCMPRLSETKNTSLQKAYENEGRTQSTPHSQTKIYFSFRSTFYSNSITKCLSEQTTRW